MRMAPGHGDGSRDREAYARSGPARASMGRTVSDHGAGQIDMRALRANLQRITDPNLRVPLGAPFEVMQSVTASGEHSVRIALKQPSPIFLKALTITPVTSERASGYPRMARTGDEIFFAWTEAGQPSQVRVAVMGLPVD